LPDGLLPKWQLVVAIAALFNTAQNFATISLTRRARQSDDALCFNSYTFALVTELQGRTFAAWTLTSAVVRLYAAYHIHEKVVYDMTLFTYLIAFGHFGTEILVFRSAKLPGPVISPVIVSTVSLGWMLYQYDTYVRS
ncbi:hypothetical protein K488DRAFT_65689, partial [Vararia minispora EC-137]